MWTTNQTCRVTNYYYTLNIYICIYSIYTCTHYNSFYIINAYNTLLLTSLSILLFLQKYFPFFINDEYYIHFKSTIYIFLFSPFSTYYARGLILNNVHTVGHTILYRYYKYYNKFPSHTTISSN